MDFIVFAARVVLAIVFAVAGLAKLADRPGTRALAVSFGVPASLAGLVEWLLPVAELACAIALIPSATATFGAIATLAMLLVFIAAISWSLAQGRRPECHCFGQIHSSPVGWTTVARNVVLAGLAAFVIVQGNANGQPGIASAAGALDRVSWLSAVLLLVVALTAVAALAMTFQLLRLNGRLALRIEALEARLGPAATPEPGLAVDTVAPRFSKDDDANGPVVLFFKQPDCGACEAMLPEVEEWQRQHQERIRIAIVEDKEVADAYQVNAFPSAVLILAGRIATPLAEGGDAIRSLVAQATLPPPFKQGDLVSSLLLSDLDGATVDLGHLAGQRTVLLFWNPSCGFCSQMLDDVKWWERHRDPRLADLVVVSTGDAASNRAQGFQSRVLLDNDFAAANRFGSGGTPSAVIVDELGRVASAVVAGAPEVLALARSASPAARPAP
jgi:thiol-disulfide isomerase/thioredoxin/uncharacterized membrane protein YphA (DoxX/SURF4 family)